MAELYGRRPPVDCPVCEYGCDCEPDTDHTPVIASGPNICGWPDVCCSRCEAEEGAEAEHLAARDRQRQALAEAIAFRDECHAYCAIDGCDC